MKIQKAFWMATLLGSVAITPFTSKAFDVGTNATYGALIITNASVTPLTTNLVMPDDGIFHCTTINIGTNCIVKFTPNALNTPVYLLAQSDIVINGTVDVSGAGGQTNGALSLAGPGGFNGGNAGFNGLAPGLGQGPGTGHTYTPYGNGGSFGSLGYSGSTNYGNLLLVPLVGGSGGGGSFYSSSTIGASGGAGGGAILLASSTSVNVAGSIVARGGRSILIFFNNSLSYCSGGGSGGGVRIVAPTVSVAGSIDVSGGTNSSYPTSGYGGNGRVRIDSPSFVIGTTNVKSNGKAGNAVVSYGRSMFIFPAASPQLYFVSVAGSNIVAGTNNSIAFASNLTNQVVVLRGTNFLGAVPIQIVATPANGTPFTTNITMNFPSQNVEVETNVTIGIPLGTATQLNAYANYGVQP